MFIFLLESDADTGVGIVYRRGNIINMICAEKETAREGIAYL